MVHGSHSRLADSKADGVVSVAPSALAALVRTAGSLTR